MPANTSNPMMRPAIPPPPIEPVLVVPTPLFSAICAAGIPVVVVDVFRRLARDVVSARTGAAVVAAAAGTTLPPAAAADVEEVDDAALVLLVDETTAAAAVDEGDATGATEEDDRTTTGVDEEGVATTAGDIVVAAGLVATAAALVVAASGIVIVGIAFAMEETAATFPGFATAAAAGVEREAGLTVCPPAARKDDSSAPASVIVLV